MSSIKQNLLPFLFLGAIAGLLLFPIWSHFDQGQDILVTNYKLSEQEDKLKQLELGFGEPLGGITRTKIGIQTAWITSLVPSASFTVNLGSSTLPVNQLFFTRASGSFGEFTSYASASLFQGSAFSGNPDCNDAGDKLLWSAGLFTCGTLSVADTSATGGTGIDISTNDFVFDATELEALTWGAGGNATNLWTFNLSAGDPTLNWTGSGATLSLNFEALGYASASSGYFSNRFRLPYLIGTVTTAGDFAIVASGLDYFNSAERLVRPRVCKTWAYEDPTAINEWGRVFYDDPFTISEITVTTSGSNSVGWNMAHGLTGAITTNVFTSNKSASSSFRYTSFTDGTLTDSEYLMLKITSASAKIENLDVTVCGTYDAP